MVVLLASLSHTSHPGGTRPHNSLTQEGAPRLAVLCPTAGAGWCESMPLQRPHLHRPLWETCWIHTTVSMVSSNSCCCQPVTSLLCAEVGLGGHRISLLIALTSFGVPLLPNGSRVPVWCLFDTAYSRYHNSLSSCVFSSHPQLPCT